MLNEVFLGGRNDNRDPVLFRSWAGSRTGLNIVTTITNLFNIIYIQLGGCISILSDSISVQSKLKVKDADNKMIVFQRILLCISCRSNVDIWWIVPTDLQYVEEIKALATSFIAVSTIIMPFCSFSHASYFTLRSVENDGHILFDSVFTWVVVVPTSFLLAAIQVWNRERVFPGTGNK